MTITTTVPTCPEWCTIDHRKMLQFGGDLTDIEGHDGPSWPEVPSMHPSWKDGSEYCAVSIGAGCDEAGAMCVYLEACGLELTPDQALQAGRHLIEAAQWAEAHHA